MLDLLALLLACRRCCFPALPAHTVHCSAFHRVCSPCRHKLSPEQVGELIASADALAASSGSPPLTTTDAVMLLYAFEAQGWAEGLAFLKRCVGIDWNVCGREGNLEPV